MLCGAELVLTVDGLADTQIEPVGVIAIDDWLWPNCRASCEP